jgi:MoxR-like ATPase
MPSPRPIVPSADRFLLRSLNLFGLDHLDPVILAALADERPLLLVGAHGTAKSELLNRLAAALNLEHRHFNASLISFDDLLGYPVPNPERDGLTWLRTPGDLWGAESVFLDEISRCRPETQNKLFSIIHERRVQGLPLEHLRYRWAAMNPPVLDDEGSVGDQPEAYLGSSPLDPALADRFPWVVTVPRLLDLSAGDRSLVIARGGQAPGPDTGVLPLVAEARARLAAVSARDIAWAAAWVEGLVLPLQRMKLELSGRRAAALPSSALAVHAAGQALGLGLSLPEAAWVALRWSLPQRALQPRIDEAALKAAHKLAERDAGQLDGALWTAIRAEADPVRRVAVALAGGMGEADRLDFSLLVHDALAAQDENGRRVLALVLSARLSRDEYLTAAACEQLANLVAPLIGPEPGLRIQSPERTRLLAEVAALEADQAPDVAPLADLLARLYDTHRSGFDPVRLVAQYREWRGLFVSGARQEVA